MKEVRHYPGFASLPPSYETIFRSSADSFFLTLPWLCHLSETSLEPQVQVRIYGVESDNEHSLPFLALPMCYDTQARKGLRPRRLLGLTNFYTSLFGPAVSPLSVSMQEDLNLLIQAIATETPHWDMVSLQPLDADSPLFEYLLQAFRSAGMAVQRYFCFGNWYLEVKGRSYAEYVETLPSRLKNTLKRKSRQLAESHHLRIHLIVDNHQVEEGIAAFEQIYRASWKTPEPYPAFMPGLVRLCAREGWLRMGIAYINNQPAAAQLWITHARVAAIYKLAYDEQFARLSIGSILTAHLMQHALDIDQVETVDYLTGDEPYKQDWMSHRRERHGIVAFNLHTLKGVLAASMHLGGRALKDIIRRPLRHAIHTLMNRERNRQKLVSSQR